jgi:hypothetical protein
LEFKFCALALECKRLVAMTIIALSLNILTWNANPMLLGLTWLELSR